MATMTVRKYRASLGMTLEAFAAEFGKTKGHFSAIENENACSPELALEIEKHSGGIVDAATLSSTIAEAREARAA